jgi:hypothetical protein
MEPVLMGLPVVLTQRLARAQIMSPEGTAARKGRPENK